MIQINNIPIIELQVNWLKMWDIGYYRTSRTSQRKIKHHLYDGKKFGVNISYIEENVPLGTGGALKNAKPHYSEWKYGFWLFCN